LEAELKEQIDRIAFAFPILRDEIDQLHSICFVGSFDGSMTTRFIQTKGGSEVRSRSNVVAGSRRSHKIVTAGLENDPCFSALAKSKRRGKKRFSNELHHKTLKNRNYAGMDGR
jgi:hypothetical protein